MGIDIADIEQLIKVALTVTYFLIMIWFMYTMNRIEQSVHKIDKHLEKKAVDENSALLNGDKQL